MMQLAVEVLHMWGRLCHRTSGHGMLYLSHMRPIRFLCSHESARYLPASCYTP